MTPGIRPDARASTRRDDQARVGAPMAAIEAGADYVVVGRPITGAANPRAATEAILSEIAAGLP